MSYTYIEPTTICTTNLTWVGYPFQSTCQTYGRIYLQRLRIICFDDHDQNNNKVFFREINNVPSFQDQGKMVNYQDPCAWFTNAYLRTLQWTFHNISGLIIFAIWIHVWYYYSMKNYICYSMYSFYFILNDGWIINHIVTVLFSI